LLGLLALFALVMAVPASVKVKYGGGQFSVWVRVLFIRLRVFPMGPWLQKRLAGSQSKPEKKPKKDKAEDRDTEAEQEKKKRTPQQTAALIKRLARAGAAAMKAFFRHLRIRGVSVVLPVHAEDASDTAVRCGQAQTAIGTARGVLANWLNIKYKKLVVIPDFTGQYKDELCFACKFVFCPGILFVMGYKFLKAYLSGRRRMSRRAYRQALARKRAAGAP
ncbi:DUF2953 domain-containing protein, partial [Ruminococcaceae bacterium OttesenSCG-928-D13]|nr:DUF2953 domain-containing protein [Ruminococcaceae bacterium OttesenSCG-928-D13]